MPTSEAKRKILQKFGKNWGLYPRSPSCAAYGLKGSIEVLLKTGKKIVLNKGVYTDKELNSLIGTELKSQMLDSRNDVSRTNKLEKVTKLTISLNDLIILVTSKMENPETPYLRIMLLVLNTLCILNQ